MVQKSNLQHFVARFPPNVFVTMEFEEKAMPFLSMKSIICLNNVRIIFLIASVVVFIIKRSKKIISSGETRQSAAPGPRASICRPLSSSRNLPFFTSTFFFFFFFFLLATFFAAPWRFFAAPIIFFVRRPSLSRTVLCSYIILKRIPTNQMDLALFRFINVSSRHYPINQFNHYSL